MSLDTIEVHSFMINSVSLTNKDTLHSVYQNKKLIFKSRKSIKRDNFWQLLAWAQGDLNQWIGQRQ